MKKFIFIVFIVLLTLSTKANTVISNIDDAIRIGLENNKDIKMKVIDLMVADNGIKSALYDLLLPSISGGFKFSVLDPSTLEKSVSKVSSFKIVTNIIGPITNVGFSIEEKTITNAFWDNYSLGFSVSYRVPYLVPIGLDVGYNSYILQVKNKELSELQYSKAVNDYIYNVKLAYYNYLFSKEFLKIVLETDKRLEENVKIAEANFKAGIFSDLEFIRAKVQLINNKPNLFSAQNNVKVQKLNLLVVLGIDVSKVDEVEIEGNIEDIKREYSNVVIDFDKEKNKIIEKNLDLAILRKLVEISEASKRVSLSANRPIISLFFNYNYEFKKTNSFENERFWVDSWVAGVQLTIPLPDALSIPISKSYLNIENSYLSAEKSLYNYQSTLNILMSQFEGIKLKIYESMENIKAQEANVEQARRSLEIITKRYEFGNASSIELIDAQLAYQQAEINLLSSWITYVNNILNLNKITSEGKI
ncbi:MAG: TolC family protein [Brevinematia bacterium]